MKLVSRLLRRRLRPASQPPRNDHRLRPQVCTLEDRRLMAAYIGNNGALVLDGTEAADRVIVSDTTINGVRHYQVDYNGATETVAASRVTNGTVEFSVRTVRNRTGNKTCSSDDASTADAAATNPIRRHWFHMDRRHSAAEMDELLHQGVEQVRHLARPEAGGELFRQGRPRAC